MTNTEMCQKAIEKGRSDYRAGIAIDSTPMPLFNGESLNAEAHERFVFLWRWAWLKEWDLDSARKAAGSANGSGGSAIGPSCSCGMAGKYCGKCESVCCGLHCGMSPGKR